jgi:hypothetical protein
MTFILNMIRLIPSSGFISQNYMTVAVVMVMIDKMMMKAIAQKHEYDSNSDNLELSVNQGHGMGQLNSDKKH